MARAVQPNLFGDNPEPQNAFPGKGKKQLLPDACSNLLLDTLRIVHGAESAEHGLTAAFVVLQTSGDVHALFVETNPRLEARSFLLGASNLFLETIDEISVPGYVFHTVIPARGSAVIRHLRFAVGIGSNVASEFLEAITNAIALRFDYESARAGQQEAEKQAARHRREVEVLYEIGQAIDQVELPRLLSLITERAASLMESQACSLMWVDATTGRLRIEASFGLSHEALAHEQKQGEGIAGRVLQTEQPLRILENSFDPQLEGLNLRPEIGSSMVVPMKSPHGPALGVLSIRRRRPSPDFTEEDLQLFSVFATQAALAILNVKLYSDLKRRADELVKLASLTRALITTFDLNARLQHLADAICGIVGFERCCVYIRDTTKPVFAPCVWRGYPDSIGRNPVREREGAIGAVAREKTMRLFDAKLPVSPERERERDYLQQKGYARSLGTDSFVAIPILTSQNRCIGVVVADRKRRSDPISDEQTHLLSTFVNQASIALENARLYEQMQENYRNIYRLKNYRDNVLRSIGVGILSTDASGRIADWNRAAEEALRRSGVKLHRFTSVK